MSNFFAALEDSDNEGDAPKVTKKASSKISTKPLEPSKPDRSKSQYNRDHGDRHTKGGRGHQGGGKRQFDRRSGTGRGKDVKKGGGGGRNWGNEKNEARKNEGPVDENQLAEGAEGPDGPTKIKEVAEGDEGGESSPQDGEDAEPEPEPEPEPEVDNTISYEEYLATKEKPNLECFAEAEIREVEDEFAGLKAKGKDEEEDFLVMGGGKQKRTREKKSEKKTVDVGFRVADPNASGGGYGDRRGRGRGRGGGEYRRDSDGGGRGGSSGGRGGRGSGRGSGRGGGRGGSYQGGRGSGRGGRGRGRGGRSGRGGLNVTDTEAFPSL